MRTTAHPRRVAATTLVVATLLGGAAQAHAMPDAPAAATVGATPWHKDVRHEEIGVPDLALGAARFSPSLFDDWATCTYLAAVVQGTVSGSRSYHLPESVIEYTNYDIDVHSSSSDAVTAGTTITVGIGSAVSIAANLDGLQPGDDILLFLGEDHADTDAFAGATYYPVGAAGIYRAEPGIKLGGESMYLRRDSNAYNIVNLLILNETKLNRMLVAAGHNPVSIP